MKSKSWAWAIGVAVAVLAAWWLAAPLLTFNALAEAARKGDVARLESLVDFPAVRASLKEQLAARLQVEIGRDSRLADNPFGALGALLAPTIVDQVVDAAVTPAGVAAMVVNGRAPLSDVGLGKTALPPPPETAPPPAPGSGKPRPKTRYAYAGFGAFKATMSADDRSSLTWILERRGLFGWKLARVELPAR